MFSCLCCGALRGVSRMLAMAYMVFDKILENLILPSFGWELDKKRHRELKWAVVDVPRSIRSALARSFAMG